MPIAPQALSTAVAGAPDTACQGAEQVLVLAKTAVEATALVSRLRQLGFDAQGLPRAAGESPDFSSPEPSILVLSLHTARLSWARGCLLAASPSNATPIVAVGQEGTQAEELAAFELGVWDYVPASSSLERIGVRLRHSLRLADWLRTQETAIERLKLMTLSDDVTGLYNQRYLYQRLEEEFERARRYERPLSLMMVDIDTFKRVNDSTDHLFGTHVLREFGRLLQSGLRQADVVFRYGGDEFSAILPEVHLEDALVATERLRATVEGHLFEGPRWSTHITASFGVASSPEFPTATAEELLRLADEALYAAKAAGRNRTAVPRGQPAATAR